MMSEATSAVGEGQPGNDKPIYLNRRQLADAFKTTPPTIDRWISDGCPIYQQGGAGREYSFDLAAVRAWRDDRIEAEQLEEKRRQAAIEEQNRQLDLTHDRLDDPGAQLPPRLRKEFYLALQQRNRLSQEQRQLVMASDCKATFERVFSFLSDQCQSLPDYLERQCNLPPEIVSEIVTAVDRWQAELARELVDSDLLRNDRAEAS